MTDGRGARRRVEVCGRWRLAPPRWFTSEVAEPGAAPGDRRAAAGTLAVQLATVLGLPAPYVSAVELDLVLGDDRLRVDAHDLSLKSLLGRTVPGRLVSGPADAHVGDVTVSISIPDAIWSLMSLVAASARPPADP